MNGKIPAEYMIESCFIFLCVAVVCVAAGCGGVVRNITVLSAFGVAAVLNIIRLMRAVKFRRAVKAGDVIFREAIIKAGFRPMGAMGLNYTAHAFAVYNDGGEKNVTHMIGTCDERLRTGDCVRIILDSRDRSMFALFEKQVRGAVDAYVFYTAICGLFSAAMTAAVLLSG